MCGKKIVCFNENRRDLQKLSKKEKVLCGRELLSTDFENEYANWEERHKDEDSGFSGKHKLVQQPLKKFNYAFNVNAVDYSVEICFYFPRMKQ